MEKENNENNEVEQTNFKDLVMSGIIPDHTNDLEEHDLTSDLKRLIYNSDFDNRLEVKVKFLENHPDNVVPEYQTEGSIGADIRYAGNRDGIILGKITKPVKLETGISIEVPDGYECQIRPRSSLASKGLLLVNSPATIDSDYRGEIMVLMMNLTGRPVKLDYGERIAQIVIAPSIKANFTISEYLSETERGDGGFGSTN